MAPARDHNVAKKRRGRPPGSRNGGATASRVAKPVATAANSKRTKPGKRPRGEEEEDELSIVAPTQTQRSESRKRKVRVNAGEIAAEPTTIQKKYVQLESKTRRIPQDVIETWPHLSPSVLEQISAVIKDAKKDITNTQRDERKIMSAHNTLNPLVKRLVRQLAASKIPPQARDIHFNIDKLTERNGHVFRDVTTARHSKQLLSEQVKAAHVLLSKDEKSLDGLKKDAKEWRAEWKRQQRHGRIHPLLENSDNVHADGDGPSDIALRLSAAIDSSAFDAPDAELAPILEQLRRSLENMQGNHVQVAGIEAGVTYARTALDDVLFKNASTEQYAAL
ncbi:uncharacterized protein EKO05_0006335 [Ascochyta rabiei]|uniref:uncharacterized protein n=1 Tax=Didymella rabiei TaxID=5454 RepID=UPI0019027DC6|nr:uncharacterized protein EKO05_0006335 [Ascochyta rabiei]UPX15902.1 hypothetical protein EKO05_0006335 [Ascochyta rabiei]